MVWLCDLNTGCWEGGWSPIPVDRSCHLCDLCFRMNMLQLPPPQGSSCPWTLVGLRTLCLRSETVTFACSSLLCVADPHTNGVRINWSELGVSVAEMSQPWVGEDSAEHSQNVLEPCGEWRLCRRWDYSPSHAPILSLLDGSDRLGSEPSRRALPSFASSARALCLVLQGRAGALNEGINLLISEHTLF